MTSPAPVQNRGVDDCLECWLRQQLAPGHCDGTLDLVDEWGCARDIDVTFYRKLELGDDIG